MQNKQAELSAAYRMGEDLYRILADQVREQSYDIKDLNRQYIFNTNTFA